MTDRQIDWLKQFSLADLVKLLVAVCAGAVAFQKVQGDVTHEAEMRQQMEQRWQRDLADAKQDERDGIARTETRILQVEQRDRDLLADVKIRMDRMEQKIDAMLSRSNNERIR